MGLMKKVVRALSCGKKGKKKGGREGEEGYDAQQQQQQHQQVASIPRFRNVVPVSWGEEGVDPYAHPAAGAGGAQAYEQWYPQHHNHHHNHHHAVDASGSYPVGAARGRSPTVSSQRETIPASLSPSRCIAPNPHPHKVAKLWRPGKAAEAGHYRDLSSASSSGLTAGGPLPTTQHIRKPPATVAHGHVDPAAPARCHSVGVVGSSPVGAAFPCAAPEEPNHRSVDRLALTTPPGLAMGDLPMPRAGSAGGDSCQGNGVGNGNAAAIQAYLRRAGSVSFRSMSGGGGGVPAPGGAFAATPSPSPHSTTAGGAGGGASASASPEEYTDILDELTRRRRRQPNLFINDDDCAIVAYGCKGAAPPPPTQQHAGKGAGSMGTMRLPPPPPPPPPPPAAAKATTSPPPPAPTMACVLSELSERFVDGAPQSVSGAFTRGRGRQPQPQHGEPPSQGAPVVVPVGGQRSMQRQRGASASASLSHERVRMPAPGSPAPLHSRSGSGGGEPTAAGIWAERVEEGCPSTSLPMASRQRSVGGVSSGLGPLTPGGVSVARQSASPPAGSPHALADHSVSTRLSHPRYPHPQHPPGAIDTEVMAVVDVAKAEPAGPRAPPAPARRGTPVPAPEQPPARLVAVLPPSGRSGHEEAMEVVVADAKEAEPAHHSTNADAHHRHYHRGDDVELVEADTNGADDPLAAPQAEMALVAAPPCDNAHHDDAASAASQSMSMTMSMPPTQAGVPELLADAWRGCGREAIWNAMSSQGSTGTAAAQPQHHMPPPTTHAVVSKEAEAVHQRTFDYSRRSSQVASPPVREGYAAEELGAYHNRYYDDDDDDDDDDNDNSAADADVDVDLTNAPPASLPQEHASNDAHAYDNFQRAGMPAYARARRPSPPPPPPPPQNDAPHPNAAYSHAYAPPPAETAAPAYADDDEVSPMSSRRSASVAPDAELRQAAGPSRGAYGKPPTAAVEIVTLMLAHGDRYTGTVKNGVPHGSGRLEYTNGNVYDGELRDGLKWGRGAFHWRNGDRYRGDFVKDVFHGSGSFTFASAETSYTGTFRNGMFAGGADGAADGTKAAARTPDANTTPLPPSQAPSPPAHGVAGGVGPGAMPHGAAAVPTAHIVRLDLSAPDMSGSEAAGASVGDGTKAGAGGMWRDETVSTEDGGEAVPVQMGKLVRSATQSRLARGGSKALFSTLKATVPAP